MSIFYIIVTLQSMAELARSMIWFDCVYCRDLKELKLLLVINQDRYVLVSFVLKLN